MSFSTNLPRPDQIAELTRSLALPLAKIDDVHLQIIAEGVVQAFEDVRTSAGSVVTTGAEAEVTSLLVSRLNRRIEEDALWRQLVICVARGTESLSYNGAHLEKRPDLSIFMSGRAHRFPLIAEAKIIDASRGEAIYCRKGIKRFIDGDYSWGSKEAFMIAYVRDGTTIKTRLHPHLVQAINVAAYAVENSADVLAVRGCDAARSSHGRMFFYSHVASPANYPGSIALWHLWVNASPLDVVVPVREAAV